MQAIAILHVDPNLVLEALPASGGDSAQRQAVNGESVRVDALDDAVAVHLGLSLSAEPEELVARLRAVAGPFVEAHQEARGIPTYPDTYTLTARTWAGIVEELGDAADWLKVSAPDPMAAMGGMPDMGQLAAMLGPEGAAFAEQLQGPGGADMMQQAMQMAQQLMQGGGGIEQMLGGVDLAAFQTGQPLDMGAIQEQAQKMLDANPELEQKIREQLEPGDSDPEED